MNDAFPFRSDPSSGEDTPYAWLDEWLCEYVDGTMDPALETVFEEYVEANPDLKDHVERLKETRNLLCHCGRMPESACTRETQADICGTVEGDLLRTDASLSAFLQAGPAVVAGLTSSVVALVLGLFTGALLFSPEGDLRSSRSLSSTPSVERIDRLPMSSSRLRLSPGLSSMPASLTAPVDSTRSVSPLTRLQGP